MDGDGTGTRSLVDHACLDLGLHHGPTAVADHLTCLERQLFYTLRGLDRRALAMIQVADDAGDRHSSLRAQLVVADAGSRTGSAEWALLRQREVAEAATRWPSLRRRALVGVSASLDRLGRRLDAVRAIADATADWPDDDRPDWRAEAYMVLALETISRSNVDYALLDRAVEEVRKHGGPLLLSVTLANFAEVTGECGDLSRAAALADAAEAVLDRHPEVLAPLTLDSVARARIALGELSAAEYDLTLALELEADLGCSDVMGDPWLTMAELQLTLGHPDRALELMDHPDRHSWAAKSAWTRSRDLDIRAEIFAAQGDFVAAYETLREHLAAYMELRSVEDDRAVAEAESRHVADAERRRAAEFEKLALTDPLTQLPNRRQVDQWLATAASRDDDQLMTVAIIDLDHFKRINDGYSHDVGDEVLRRVAEVLAAPAGTVNPDRMVGRLGGEEFVQLSFGSAEAASQQAQLALGRVRALHWDDVAPGLQVTASIGIASGPSAQARSLMGDADARLYAAKRAGRNRIVDRAS